MKSRNPFPWSLLTVVFVVVYSTNGFTQKVLPEITIISSNYKYLNALSPEEAAQPVNMLEHYAAAYDVKESGLYEEEHDTYIVSFHIPEGKILASYDDEGTLVRTAERYKNIALPKQVVQAVAKRFPQWAITKDAFVVNYYSGTNVTKKIYKLLLENGDKRLRVKVSDSGDFL